MYLKSIEIQGFKSFANKIVFEFHNGITGIVGPNGSGKSNVADAVRWVLGEQRIKQLRGANMQDVIFSGTETRKPQGFAYVSITLDNSDHQLSVEFDQVTVSRRIYRSGESEYKINGSACRLKDINELFYDTGIGKEGYSIIGQGQIDKILSGRPEERRELFDEAAGIVKFKRRKALALKKLEDERQNLVRVKDILSELEKQVGPLARQSETAREYLRLKEELRLYDVNLFLLETENLKAQSEEVSSKEALVSRDLFDSKQEADGLKQQYDELDEALSLLDQRIGADREELNRSNVSKGGLEGRINVLNEQIHTERINEDHIQNRVAAIQSSIGEKKEDIGAREEERAQLSQTLAEARARQAVAEQSLKEAAERIASLDARIDSSKSSVITTLNEKASLAARQQRYEAMLEQVNVRRSEVCQRLLKIKSEESVQEEQKRTELLKLTAIDERLEKLAAGQERSQEQADRFDQEVHRLTRNLSESQQEYHKHNNKLESLKNIAERYEGYGNSIRRVMETKDRIHGIHGVVADLITVSKEYEVAIETALGGNIQNIVTDSEQTAKQLIEYLKKNRYGRATFLPLTSLNGREGVKDPLALKEPGVLGLASGLAQADPQYAGLLGYLLGRVVVVDTIDHAIALARKYRYSLRIVTLEGELLNPGGSMSGGAFKNSSNLLGRKREIEELEERCRKILQSVDQIQQDLAVNEGLLEGQKEELERIRTDRQKAGLEQNTVRMSISQIETRIREIVESSRDLVRENQQLEEQIRQIGESKKELEELVTGLEEQGELVSQDIGRLSGELESAKEERDRRSTEVSEASLGTAGLEQKHQFIEENIGRVREEISRLEQELSGLTDGRRDSKEIIASKQTEIEEIQKAIAETDRRMEALEAAVADGLAGREELAARQKGFFRKREELSDRISSLDKEIFRLQNQKEKLEERLESQISYMWDEYELTFSSAEELRKDDLGDYASIRKRIDGLKTSIRGLGNVNVNAIEDYREISERYEFMSTQHDDLVRAEETLIQIIEELDTGMRNQFTERFREIQREFDKVFRELFGGGRGTLELTEGEDILEAGIQIVSQPPGKKLQNMMQLSGGEKALTAIALLFAIQNLKPSPFCLLDEIEAALDDSNVDRFAGYLHKLTKNTQFIVITHRRGTMVSSDRLYGITMQEKGVSTLISVNLIENDLDK